MTTKLWTLRCYLWICSKSVSTGQHFIKFLPSLNQQFLIRTKKKSVSSPFSWCFPNYFSVRSGGID